MNMFLVDLGRGCNFDLRLARVEALKKLFESQTVTTVIYDCKMDMMALFSLFGITLAKYTQLSCYFNGNRKFESL